jgi:hypothetical protein
MERLHNALKQLESAKVFKDWKKENKESYFSYAFSMVRGKNELEDWQLGFYDKKKDKVTTFVVKKDDVDVRLEEDVFKKQETEVKEINMEQAKLGIDAALKKANEFQKEKYSKELPAKIILILQNLPGLGNLWNITYVTQTFNTLNMKISSSTGKILEHKLMPLMDFRAK